jgi:hypothetical protein
LVASDHLDAAHATERPPSPSGARVRLFPRWLLKVCGQTALDVRIRKQASLGAFRGMREDAVAGFAEPPRCSDGGGSDRETGIGYILKFSDGKVELSAAAVENRRLGRPAIDKRSSLG